MSTLSHEHCPGCERFIGTEDVCPYCDNDSIRHYPRRRIRIASWFLTLTGLSIIWLLRSPAMAPARSPGDAQWSVSGRKTTVVGRVATAPFFAMHGTYASFTLVDGAGSLRVSVEGAAAQTLSGSTGCPVSGQVVQVTGVLRSHGRDGLRLCIETPDSITPGSPSTSSATPRSSRRPPAAWRILQPHLYWLLPVLSVALIASPMRTDGTPGLSPQNRFLRMLRRRTGGIVAGAAIAALAYVLGTAPTWRVFLPGILTAAGLTGLAAVEKIRKRDMAAGILMAGLELTALLLHTPWTSIYG